MIETLVRSLPAAAVACLVALSVVAQQQPGVQIADLPPAAAAAALGDVPRTVVEVTAVGELLVDGTAIEADELAAALRARAADGPQRTVRYGGADVALSDREVLLRVAGGVSCAVLEPLLDACAAARTPLAVLAVRDGDDEHGYPLFLRLLGDGPDELPLLQVTEVPAPMSTSKLFRALRDAVQDDATLLVRAGSTTSVEVLVNAFDVARRAGVEQFEVSVGLTDAQRRAVGAGDLTRLVAATKPDDQNVGRQFDGSVPRDPAADRLARALVSPPSAAGAAIGPGGGVGGVFGGRAAGRRRLARGGGAEVAAAIARGLEWLRLQQGADGSWAEGDVVATANALLAFLADGSTVRSGEYRDVVELATLWLRDVETDGGGFGVGGLNAQAVATVAVVEAFGLSQLSMLEGGAQRALDRLLAMRDPDGAWRDGGEDEAHIAAECVLAWRVARDLGLEADPLAADATVAWLASMAGTDDAAEGAAEAAVWAAFLAGDAAAARGLADALVPQIPAPQPDTDLRTVHDGTAAVHQYGGPRWRDWIAALGERVIAAQRDDGALAGSWDPDQAGGPIADRVGATARACSTLAVHHRFGPLAR